ncbi:MAG: SusC/RagA family TonB-linked outer membrane protein [Bacteroidota bacterium]
MKNVLIRLAMIYALIFVPVSMLAQEIEISGTVSFSEDNSPIPGVNVVVEGTSAGTITNFDGFYTIKANKGSKLKFSFIGYETKIVEIGSEATINVSMNVSSETIDDVVVTALGVSRKEEALGYSVTKVGGEEFSQVKELNAINSIAGKVAGVEVRQGNTGVGGSSKVLIRGNSTFGGSNQPLYVIDGVPMDNQNLGSAGEWGGVDLGDGISSINPDDIETMSVLKGPAAAALYGSRASNGVILITTKKWKRGSNKFNIDFNSNTTVDLIANNQYDDVQKVYGQGITTPPKDISEANNMWSWGGKMSPDLEFISFDGEIRDYGVKQNNINSFFKPGYTTQNSIAFSGGNEQTSFRFSAGDVRNEDIVPNSGLTRQNFDLKGTMKMWEKLTVDAKINYTREDVKNRPYLGYSGANVARAITTLPMSFDQAWLEESRTDANGNYQSWNSNSLIINPYYSLYNMANNSKKNRVMGYGAITYEFFDWLNLKIKSGIDSYDYTYYSYAPKTTPNQESGEMSQLLTKTTEINSEFLLSYNHKFLGEDLKLDASLGGNIMQYNNQQSNVLGKSEIASGIISINNYQEFTMLYANPRKQINSLYAFANLGYKEYLFLDVTARNDWTSTLPLENNSFFYPSVSASWVFSSQFENLKSKYFSYGKIRASYAEVGGDTDPYNLTRSYYSYPYSLNGITFSTESGNVMPNPDLKPSRTRGYEAGANVKFLDWRVGLDFTYYNQSTYDEIINLPISATSAYSYAFINAGEINNQGYEVLLHTVPLKMKDLRWDLTFNWAQNTNKVIKLHEEAKTQELSRASWISSYIQAEEGQSYGDIIGYDFKRTSDGQIIYASNGMPLPTDEQVVIGNGQYDWTGGMASTINYKGIVLRAAFDVKWGADVLSMTNMKMYQYGTHVATLEGREEWAQSEQERLDAGVAIADWVATGGFLGEGVVNTGTDADPVYETNTVYVNPKDYYSQLTNSHIMSPYVYDASYVKLRELSLSYTFAGEKLKSKVFESISVSLIARNLWLIWSNLPNVDPESTYSISNGQGYEYGSLPYRRSFGFNVGLKF